MNEREKDVLIEEVVRRVGQSLGASEKLRWDQEECAAQLSMSVSWLRDSDCPKTYLPGNGPKGQPVPGYDPEEVRAWFKEWQRRFRER